MSHPTVLLPGATSLLVIDVQEKLLPLIPRRRELVQNVAFAVDVAKVVNVPILATEQYPRGLGPTVPELAAKLGPRLEKTAFSCCAAPGLAAQLASDGRDKVLLVGMETHVCVLHTALDLLAHGLRPYVAADAVASRQSQDHDVALRRMEIAGAVVTTVETVAFEWVGQSGTPEFKAISKLVQERMKLLS